jgi:hypothetical protein
MTIRTDLLALIATFALGIATAVQAEERIVPVDHGIETNTEWLLMPSSASGSITMTCPDCKAQSYRLTNETVFRIGRQTVSFQEFSTYVRGQKLGAMLFVGANDSVVTRVHVSSPSTPSAGR